ncbi:cinnamoyl-CoA reductase 1 isoform X7 [Cryptomeria japonica]|uniref:cinnamoyl-CoA reductase 1 isoform X7 n=1 Tax=Cryptomeria japonica TaxID=3369 RepID=UPI0025ABE946|nr:cinnamoyl-CoA reductase 1 isoform X7 [Cryptomeria japonica]
MEESSKETVCVTGAGGFLGSWIVNLLLQRGYNVRGTVRDVGDAKNAHLKSLEGAKERLKLLNAVLSDYDSLFTAINGCTGVFHTACPVPSHRVSNPEAEMVNPSVKGTLNVLKACSVAKVKRVIMTSSVVAVFVNPNRPMDALLDESCWSDPEYCEATENWYFMSKTVSEKNAWNCSKEFGLDLITICPSLILGPMLQPNTNASCLFIIKLLTLYPSDSSPILKVPFGTRTWKHILYPQGLMTQERRLLEFQVQGRQNSIGDNKRLIKGF